jgi:hypothetical protein
MISINLDVLSAYLRKGRQGMEELKVDKAKQTLDAGKSLAWAGAIIGWISGRIVDCTPMSGQIGLGGSGWAGSYSAE